MITNPFKCFNLKYFSIMCTFKTSCLLLTKMVLYIVHLSLRSAYSTMDTREILE